MQGGRPGSPGQWRQGSRWLAGAGGPLVRPGPGRRRPPRWEHPPGRPRGSSRTRGMRPRPEGRTGVTRPVFRSVPTRRTAYSQSRLPPGLGPRLLARRSARHGEKGVPPGLRPASLGRSRPTRWPSGGSAWLSRTAPSRTPGGGGGAIGVGRSPRPSSTRRPRIVQPPAPGLPPPRRRRTVPVAPVRLAGGRSGHGPDGQGR